jgi:hypothetical protein
MPGETWLAPFPGERQARQAVVRKWPRPPPGETLFECVQAGYSAHGEHVAMAAFLRLERPTAKVLEEPDGAHDLQGEVERALVWTRTQSNSYNLRVPKWDVGSAITH